MAYYPLKPKDCWGDPLFPIEDIQREMYRIFDLNLGRFPKSAYHKVEWFPAVDIKDHKDKVTVYADLPGMTKDQIQIELENNTLVLKGEKGETREIKEKDFIQTERYWGSFQRCITLPTSIDTKNVKATYKDGVLEIVLLKKEDAQAKHIRVEVT